jgi:hypothetical protein
MSDEADRLRLRPEREPAVQPASPAFEEVPGEPEADAVRDAFLSRSGAEPAELGPALSGADGGVRARAVSRLQRERGNAYVQRVVAEARGAPGRLVGKSQPEMVGEVLQRKGSGSPLPQGTRQQMEGHFGADLSGVRVHSDGEAAALSRELQAQAFTVGSDVFFAEGKYDPSSRQGQGLLAHELTHVGQQTGFGGQAVQRQESAAEEVQRQESAEEEEQEGSGEE